MTEARSERPSILIVDDQPEVLHALERLLKPDYTILTAGSGAKGLDLLKNHPVSVILTDQRMPGMTGVEFLSKAQDVQPYAMRMMITAYADIEASVAAVNRGRIYQYISKPWEPDELLLIVKQAVERYQLEEENRILSKKLEEANRLLQTENQILKQTAEKEVNFSNLIGSAPAMLAVFSLVKKVVDSPTTVLIQGETGTGKELLAKAIHYNSSRRNQLFVAQNCGALPDTLLESELFGHVKGAFTGAASNKKGLFEMADKGTVFLDEVADMSPAMQQRLLRVLQEGEVRPVGSTQSVFVDVRIVAASNKSLEAEVQTGRFREDLFYRLCVFPVLLPPLRERKTDIPELVHHFIKKYGARLGKSISMVESDAMDKLTAYAYPGNIRELENEIQRALTLAENGAALKSEHLSLKFQPAQSGHFYGEGSLKACVESLEKEMIQEALKETKGNILRAAEQLGLSRAGLHKKLNRYGISASL